MSGPQINRNESSGEIHTPKVFITAVERKFGPLHVDLAATAENTCAPHWLTKADDSLAPERRWHRYGDGLLWLNPPYDDIASWAEKCAHEHAMGANILLLVPGSVGANWFWDHVAGRAFLYSVGRIAFDNCYDRKTGKLVRTPYPKDLLLCYYLAGARPTTELIRWQWRAEINRAGALT